MSRIIQDYLDLITSEHSSKPKFVATVSLSVAPFVQIQSLLDSMIPLFDLDTPPVGDQLDIIGQWVGVSRFINVPLTGIFFSWDNSDPTLGWDAGSWQDPNNTGGVTELTDPAYLTLIKAKIAANQWDGTTESAYAIYSFVFPGYNILIQDYQDMSFSIIVEGNTLDALTQALLTGGYLPLKPEGVLIRSYILPVDSGPLFGWDLENDYFQGWDTGSWGIETMPT